MSHFALLSQMAPMPLVLGNTNFTGYAWAWPVDPESTRHVRLFGLVVTESREDGYIRTFQFEIGRNGNVRKTFTKTDKDGYLIDRDVYPIESYKFGIILFDALVNSITYDPMFPKWERVGV